MKPFHKRRLLKLAAHLKTVPREKFNMRYFGGPVLGCATDGCAAGHAADIFRRQGYTCGPIPVFPAFTVPKANSVPRYYLPGRPTFKSFIGGEAIREFFGIGDDGYNFIFSSANAPSTPKQVAKRIEEFVK